MLFEAGLNTIVRFLVLVVIIALTARVARLQRALLERLTTLEGLLPICCCCHRIRDERQQWEQFETYIASRSDAEFTHSICADCTKEFYGDLVR